MAFDFTIVGLAVRFFDRTTFVASTWSWDFGDGDTSTVREPTHNYASPGNYTVTLTATCGSRTSSVSKTLQITNSPTPQALAVSLSSPVLFGTEYGPAYDVDVLTNFPVAAIASGGTAPYSYEWLADTANGHTFSGQEIWPSSPVAAATTFFAKLQSPDTHFTNWLRAFCRVTDAVGTVVDSSIVRVFLTASFDTYYAALSTDQLITEGSNAELTSAAVSVAVTGGSGNFSYQWAVYSLRAIVVNDDTTDTATVTISDLNPGETYIGALNVVVTDDDSGEIVVSDWVQLVFTRSA